MLPKDLSISCWYILNDLIIFLQKEITNTYSWILAAKHKFSTSNRIETAGFRRQLVFLRLTSTQPKLFTCLVLLKNDYCEEKTLSMAKLIFFIILAWVFIADFPKIWTHMFQVELCFLSWVSDCQLVLSCEQATNVLKLIFIVTCHSW